MGKLKFLDDRNGFEFISDNGYHYDLLEGKSIGGKSTSDIVFVLLSDDFTERIDVSTDYVGHLYGANYVDKNDQDTIDAIDGLVKKYEEKEHLEFLYNRYEDQANRLCQAIKTMADNESSLDNFKSYVSQHGVDWFNTYCKDFSGLISELEQFSKIN